MRPTRQHTLLALAAAGLVAIIAYLAFSGSLFTSPGPDGGTADSAAASSPDRPVDAGAPSMVATIAPNSTNSATAPASASVPPLDDLRSRAEVYGKRASELCRRYRIADSDPESFDASMSIDTSPKQLADMERDEARRRDMLATMEVELADVRAAGERKWAAVAADMNGGVPPPRPVAGQPGPAFEPALEKARERAMARLREMAEARMKAEQTQLEESGAILKTLHHPDEAIREYATAKEDYLMAKARYQAARLVPLPAEQTKDWRRPVSHSK